MKTFLEYVAADILGKFGTDLSHTAIVFPNKRASLFINEHFARLSDRPLWSPAYVTISDLFRSQSGLTVADPLKLVSDLHHSFLEATGIDETLDHFWGWGQLLLADFDDVDKNMADASHVFANVSDLHELDDMSFLTDEQRTILSQFFRNFSPDDNSQLKERFLQLWSHLADIYSLFKERLRSQSLAYEGMLYRDVAEQPVITLDYDRYIFVGFNLLHQVEQKLFSKLQKEGKAHFYWDFDNYYMKDHEAGYYISQYLQYFPNELDNSEAGIYDQFRTHKTMRFVAAPTENIQAHYVSEWLSHNQRKEHGGRTAILLCNEDLLPSVINCLPEDIGKMNITTGYPLSQTPIASLIKLLLNWQTTDKPYFAHKALERHPYYQFLDETLLDSCKAESDSHVHDILLWLCEIVRTVARKCHQSAVNDSEQHNAQDNALRDEAIFRAYTLLNRMAGLAASGDLDIQEVTLQRLVSQLIQSTSIPFHGEPIEGIQLMGILESRNLDFDHVLLLSCNEGNMPKGVNDNSFIPHSIRKAYGLTTVEHKTAIYAYYFHHLLQRASDVTLVYNNATSEGNTGEMSRFMLQLLVEGGHDIERQHLQLGQATSKKTPISIPKTKEVMDILMRRFAKKSDNHHALLTPTAINSYRSCPLKFFYTYVAGLRKNDEEELQIDDRLFGLVFHKAAEIIYQQLTLRGQRIEAAQIDLLLKSKIAIEQAVDQAFDAELPAGVSRGGLHIINREVIIHYLRQLLKIDLQMAPFHIKGMEKEVVEDFPVYDSEGNLSFTTTIGGTIDRLDAVHVDTERERIRAVDYKTGKSKMNMLKDVDDIFAKTDSHHGYYVQTLIYSLIVSRHQQLNPAHLPVSPALLFIQHAAEENYDPTLCFDEDPITDADNYRAPFTEQLQKVVNDIFNPQSDFVPTADENICRNCPFANLCDGHQ